MVELKNISTLNLTGIGTLNKNPMGLSKKNLKLIKDNKLTDYQQLNDFYFKFKDEKDSTGNSIICDSDRLKYIISDINKSVRRYLEPEIFEYYELGDNANALYNHEAVDKNTSAAELLYGSPFEYVYNDSIKRKRAIAPLSVYELKQCLSHCDVYGTNLLKKICKIDDDKEINKILIALAMYEEQLERQAFDLTGNESEKDVDNLFYLNYQEKAYLVKEQLKEINEYLKNRNEKNYFESYYGFLVSTLDYCIYHHLPKNVRNREIFIRLFANNVSLEEAQKGLVRTKAIDRFIVK